MFVKTDEKNKIIKYPYSLEQFRLDNKNRSLPKTLNNKYLASRFVFPVYAEPEPDYNYALQNIRRDIDNPYLAQDGVWKYGWIITDKTEEQCAEYLQNQKTIKNQEIDKARDNRIFKTFYFSISETVTVPVDIRKGKSDIQNINSLVQYASIQLMKKSEIKSIDFRGADNKIYQLTPNELILLGEDIVSNYSDVYKKSWVYKDAVELANSVSELEEIEIIF